VNRGVAVWAEQENLWPYSTFHRLMAEGVYPENWARMLVAMGWITGIDRWGGHLRGISK